MGQRHNRRRVRSRPRHRRNNRYNTSISSISSTNSSASTFTIPKFSCTALPICGPTLPSYRPDQPWQWQLNGQVPPQSAQDSFWALEQRRIYGGEPGDEEGLCAPMLQVVLDLFNGVDYEDP